MNSSNGIVKIDLEKVFKLMYKEPKEITRMADAEEVQHLEAIKLILGLDDKEVSRVVYNDRAKMVYEQVKNLTESQIATWKILNY